MTAQIINGRAIADQLLADLKKTVQEKHLHPVLAVILIGDNPASLSFIKQKQKAAQTIGASVQFIQLPETASDDELSVLIQKLNKDTKVDGIIVQRPLPQKSTVTEKTLQKIVKTKDIDGFIPGSPFDVPVARAVVTILEAMYHTVVADQSMPFLPWVQKQGVMVIGKGQTAGWPVISAFERLGVPTTIIDRATKDPYTVMKSANILISCVGKEGFLIPKMIKQDALVISVGVSRGEDGKLHGDYEDEEIEAKASALTPTPGGVGPVNVASLMQNLVKACIMKTA